MRLARFVSLWVFRLVAFRSSTLREEEACGDDGFRRMGDRITETEEVEKHIKEVVCAQSSGVHVGGSGGATQGTWPRRQPMPTPPTSRPLPRVPWMPYPSITPGHVRGLFPWLAYVPARAYFSAPTPWGWPLPVYFPTAPHLRILPHVFRGHRFMPVPVHFLARVPTLAPEHHGAHVPGRDFGPMRVPMPPPALPLARVSRRAAMSKFVMDVEAAGKHLQMSALMEAFERSGSYPDLMASVELLFEIIPTYWRLSTCSLPRV